jgi:hypothetical protein
VARRTRSRRSAHAAYVALDTAANYGSEEKFINIAINLVDLLIILDHVDLLTAEIAQLRQAEKDRDRTNLASHLTRVREALAKPEDAPVNTCTVCGHIITLKSHDWHCDHGCRCLMSGCVLDRSKEFEVTNG